MTDFKVIIGTAIRSRLLADPVVAGLVGTQAFQHQAPKEATHPHILFVYAGGGKQNDSADSGFDMFYSITAVAKTQPQANSIASLIHDLFDEQYVTYTGGYEAFAPVTEQELILQSTDVQTDQYWRSGAVYRFRGARVKREHTV